MDAQAQIIIAAEPTDCGADRGELLCMLAAVDANLATAAELVLADAGYRANKARAEWELVCAALNSRRLSTLCAL